MSQAEGQSTHDVARAFTELCRAGKFEEAGHRFWAEHVVSREAMDGPMAVATGRAAVQAKTDWWTANHEVHDASVEGPYVNGDQFALRFTIDVTPKGGARTRMDEIAIYTVADGKVVEERFFYGG